VSAGDQDAERAPDGERRAEPPRSRYSTFVGLAVLALVGLAALNGLRTDEDGLLGTGGIAGQPIAEFAVPDIRGPLDLDANLAQDDCETSRNPCPPDDRRVPACEIEAEGAIRVCDLFDRPLVISFWFTRGADCLDAQDTLDEVARRYRDRVNFLSLNVHDERDEVERIVAERGWRVPVGWDRDGAVSNLFGVGVCPTFAFAFPGGILQSAAVEQADVTPAKLGERVERLVRQSGRRGP
jgi:thiol-disulfide isomerase/thioredoxin